MKHFNMIVRTLSVLFFLVIVQSCGKKQDNNPAPSKSSAKGISAFSVTINGTVTNGTVDGSSIKITVPYGTDVTALSPTISASDKAAVSPKSGTPQNFTSPVTYTVTAEDGSTQTFTITVIVGKSPAKAITGFSFSTLNPAITASVNDTTKKITATLPYGTPLTALAPTITVSAKATVSPASGAAADFSKPVNYTVTAEDGSTQVYQVTATLAQPQPIVVDCTGAIPADWKDVSGGVDYIVKCNIPITKTLIIEPGVTIQFDGAASGFTVTGSGALQMIGTADKPIVLEGKTAVAGSWTGVQIASGNLLNDWEYVTIKDAGGAIANKAGVLIADNYAVSNGGTQLTVKNCSFLNNSGYGLWDYDQNYSYGRVVFKDFESNTFSNNQLSALRITMDALGKLDTKSTYVNNGQKYIELDGLNHGLTKNTIMQKLDATYQIDDYINLNQKLTINAGVQMQFLTDAGFILGTGTLIANGTASDPIKFSGYKPGIGVWRGLALLNTDPEIALNYCVIDGAGSNKLPSGLGLKCAVNLYIEYGLTATNASITHCTISNSGGYGIIYKKGLAGIVIQSNTYQNNTLADEQAFQ
ncbi:DUF5018 domain-containing protein [Mucilaginibacter corticis]|uniref:DUF5018 domain-containing protein n=1 Tax=Mucilaginibacter corticis TaxID=2597670 RepID=A0A556M7P9_9SPHI|nr:DUF5018 domain-containing protein [Mucilaginibacter corticis]TSJ35919.1 DUF5018 domain-containing protein [Mucilaginibacter corticis]